MGGAGRRTCVTFVNVIFTCRIHSRMIPSIRSAAEFRCATTPQPPRGLIESPLRGGTEPWARCIRGGFHSSPPPALRLISDYRIRRFFRFFFFFFSFIDATPLIQFDHANERARSRSYLNLAALLLRGKVSGKRDLQRRLINREAILIARN